MFIQELPTDLIISICHEVVTNDTKNNVLGKLKNSVLKLIEEFNVKWDNEAILSEFGEDFDKDIYEDELECIIYDHIKNMNQKDKDTIVYDYGIIKAIKLLNEFQRNGCYDSSAEICEYMASSEETSIYNDIIILIVKDEIKFRNDWRNN
jgi:hypothetical protein